MISKKHSLAAKKNIQKAYEEGKTKHFGNKNPKWNGGNRTIGDYPCPVCHKPLCREKRYASLSCAECGRKYRRPRVLKEGVSRAAYYWRARKFLIEAGITISKEDHIHHKNGNWKDNRIENLLVVDKYEHRRRFHNPSSSEFVF